MSTPASSPVRVPARPVRAGWLVVAAFASLGAGAIHAAAVGVHSEHRQAVLAFTGVAAFQLGWCALALLRPSRPLALIGALGSVLAIGGWLLAKTGGIGFVDGLDQAEDLQLADGLAAGLAAVVIAGALAFSFDSRRVRLSSETGRALVGAAAVAIVVLTVPGMVAAGSHDHSDGHDDAGGEGANGHGTDAGHGASHDEVAAAPPKPYDPTQPIDLGGVPGVSPEQQARAENLIAVTLLRLPRYADTATAEADGFRSIGDAVTGEEHFVNWSYVDDDKILDADYPESLVYRVEGRTRTLVAAMFMLPNGSTLDDVPDVGGELTQWHVHNDLCFTADPVAPRVAGFVGVDQPCRPPLVKRGAPPMIHVWIVPHPCGPFAALEGVGAGQIQEGEERLCDHAHGGGV